MIDKILDKILDKMAIVRKEIDTYGYDDDAVRVYDAIVEIVEMFRGNDMTIDEAIRHAEEVEERSNKE